MRGLLVSAALAVTLVVGVPATATANEIEQPDPSSTDSSYTPKQQTEPTLAGSTAVGECDGDVPWILYSITLVDPDEQATANTARLVLSDGANSTVIPLGELVDDQLEGRVLWPGASVDEAGNADGWPGWTMQNGEWVQTSGNFAWTRGDITAVIEVNPSLTVPLSYPPATPGCTDPVEDAAAPASLGSLAVTGLGAAIVPISVVGGILAILGIALLVLRRRARS